MSNLRFCPTATVIDQYIRWHSESHSTHNSITESRPQCPHTKPSSLFVSSYCISMFRNDIFCKRYEFFKKICVCVAVCIQRSQMVSLKSTHSTTFLRFLVFDSTFNIYICVCIETVCIWQGRNGKMVFCFYSIFLN